MYGEFQKLDTVILGISPDDQASHQKFIEATKVRFPLLCDMDKKVMTKYEAFGEKKMYGKVTMGVIRSTVWVGPDGKVKKHWRNVAKAADHPATVLETLKSELA
ncbi:MAG: redoxin domain-containing protein [Desulfobacterales bacterium]|nr:MAG: redoxin domain-containing protein [Desulfobacterales bacterium]